MDPKELYERQYGNDVRCIRKKTFPVIRKLSSRFDKSREDTTIEFLNNEGGKLIDVGCGDGVLIFKVAHRFEELYGIDISTHRIRKAKEKASNGHFKGHKICFEELDVSQRWDISSESFDVATCIDVLEHLFDPYHVLDEINRVLKPRGKLILCVPNIAYIRHRISLLFGKLPRTSGGLNWRKLGWDGGHLHYFTKRTLVQLLNECGFTVLGISGSGLLADIRNWWPSLLTGNLCVKAVKISCGKGGKQEIS